LCGQKNYKSVIVFCLIKILHKIYDKLNKTGKKKLNFLLWIGLAALIVYGAFSALIFIFQSRLIYFPEKTVAVTPDAIGLAYEHVNFTAADGARLSGWFIPSEKHRAVLLFCHGNAGNISHRLESIHIFHSLGLSVFIFDYRGYGSSEGKTTEQGTYRDAEAAWNYLINEKEYSPSEIITFGRSLGGAVAAWLAQNNTPMALILESTFTSAKDLGAEIFPFLPVRWLSRFSYDAVRYLRSVKSPVLIIHSRNDDIVPFKNGKRLFETANNPKEFLEISGSHNDGFIISGDRYIDGINSFISGYAPL